MVIAPALFLHSVMCDWKMCDYEGWESSWNVVYWRNSRNNFNNTQKNVDKWLL